MDVMNSRYESDDEPRSVEMLGDICDGSQSHTNVKRGEARYKICGCIKQK